MKASYTWLCELVSGLEKIPARELADRLTFAGLEVEAIEETAAGIIFEVNVTPNRGDVLGHRGLAIEISALTGLALLAGDGVPKSFAKNLAAVPAGDVLPKLHVHHLAQETCSRYSASTISGVSVKPSPDWLKARLEVLGVRSINTVVDATNYVMLLTGHPVHAFDGGKISEHTIVIRELESAQRYKTLDAVERELHKGDLVIADAHQPIALAGVMGGEDSEVMTTTRDLVLEVAQFSPDAVRRTARRLGLKTESSYRFERFVSPEGVSDAHRILQKLIVALAGGTPSAISDSYPNPAQATQIAFDIGEVKRLLGIVIPQDDVIAILQRLGCHVQLSHGRYQVTVPNRRPDLTRPADLVEEIARLHGMEKIPAVMPRFALHVATESQASSHEREVKEFFVQHGFSETLHYSFGDPDWFAKVLKTATGEGVALKNPLSADLSVLRPSLLPHLLSCYLRNYLQARRGLRIFELRTVFGAGGLTEEKRVLAGLYAGNPLGKNRFGVNRADDFYDGKGILDKLFLRGGLSVRLAKLETWPFHPTQGVSYEVKGWTLARLGALHPELLLENKIKERLFYFEIEYDAFSTIYRAKLPQFKPINPLPPVYRDLALLAPANLSHQEILDVIHTLKPPQLTRIELFDLYQGPNLEAGKKSVAYSFVYEPADEALTDEAVNRMHFELVEKLSRQLGVVLR